MELNTLNSFFKGDYMPHGHCYLWQPHILWTNVISDLFIAVAYFSLPIALVLFSMKRKDIENKQVFVLFSLFILCCGITHVISIFTIWHGIYGVHGISKAATALVSIMTTVYVFKLLPSAVNLPSISQYKAIEGELIKTSSNLASELEHHKLTNFILNSIPISAIMLDDKQEIIFKNQTFNDEFPHDVKNVNTSLLDIIEFTTEDLERCSQFYLSSTDDDNKLSIKAFAKVTLEPLEINFKKSNFENKTSILVTLKNLTEISTVKSKLVKSHQRLQRAISATEDGIWEWDVKEDRVDYSPKLMEIIGKPTVMSPTWQDWFSHIHLDHQSRVQAAIDQHFTTQKKYIVEYLGLDKNHEYSWFVAIGNSVFDEENKPIVMSGSLRNIDLTKKLEEVNRENTDFIKAIYDGFSQAIWVISIHEQKEYIFEEYNNAACKWTGVLPEQVIGQSLSALSGNLFPTEMAEQLKQNYDMCKNTKDKFNYIEKITLVNKPKWYQTTLYPLLDNDNNVYKIVSSAIDVTNEQLLVEELKQSNDYLERFAFVASHDLQEPLRKIIAFSELLNDRLEVHLTQDDEAKYQFSRLTSAAKRMKEMINDILSLSRINSAKLTITPCKLTNVVAIATENLTAVIAKSDANIRIDTPDALIHVDASLFSHLFQNLISNAIKFTGEGIKPEISIAFEKRKNGYQINCQDNGIGIPEEFQQQIFEPFRRLHAKNKYEGSGIGLSLCQQIMKVHHGKIQCQSEVGGGSCFSLIFDNGEENYD